MILKANNSTLPCPYSRSSTESHIHALPEKATECFKVPHAGTSINIKVAYYQCHVTVVCNRHLLYIFPEADFTVAINLVISCGTTFSPYI